MKRLLNRPEISDSILELLARLAKTCWRKIFHHEHHCYHGHKHYEGEMIVCHGVHKIFVKTGRTPRRVWISEEDCGYPVCQGQNQNTYSVCIVKGGFFIICDIYTNHAHIRWFIRYDSRLHDDKKGRRGEGKF